MRPVTYVATTALAVLAFVGSGLANIFDLTGAAASRAAANDGAIMVLVPLSIATLVAVSWATRPASRELPAARVDPMLAEGA